MLLAKIEILSDSMAAAAQSTTPPFQRKWSKEGARSPARARADAAGWARARARCIYALVPTPGTIANSPCRACLRLSRLQERLSRAAAAAPRCSCAGSSPTRVAGGGRAIRAPRSSFCPMTVDCACAGVRWDSRVPASRARAARARRGHRVLPLKCPRRRTSASRWCDLLHFVPAARQPSTFSKASSSRR